VITDSEDWSPLKAVESVLCSIEAAELSLPHIVITRDGHTGRMSFAGPYPTSLEALVAAETESRVDRDGGASGLTFQVAALYPPLR